MKTLSFDGTVEEFDLILSELNTKAKDYGIQYADTQIGEMLRVISMSSRDGTAVELTNRGRGRTRNACC